MVSDAPQVSCDTARVTGAVLVERAPMRHVPDAGAVKRHAGPVASQPGTYSGAIERVASIAADGGAVGARRAHCGAAEEHGGNE